MSSNQNIIQSYLVQLTSVFNPQGFKQSQQSFQQLNQSINITSTTLSNANNKIQTFFKATIPQISTVKNAVSTALLTISPEVVLLIKAFTALAAGIAAVTAGVVGFGLAMGSADIQTQIFANRMLTTVKNARSLKTVMDAMGIKSIEELKDINLNPELRKQFMELRKITLGLEPNADTKEGLHVFRTIGYEWQKLSVQVSYGLLRFAGMIGQNIAGPLKELFATVSKYLSLFSKKDIETFLKRTAEVLGLIVNTVITLITLWTKFVTKIAETEKAILKIAKPIFDLWDGFVKSIGDIERAIWKIVKPILLLAASLAGLLTGHNKGQNLGSHIKDVYSDGENVFKKIEGWLRKIFELLYSIVNFFRMMAIGAMRFLTRPIEGVKSALGSAGQYLQDWGGFKKQDSAGNYKGVGLRIATRDPFSAQTREFFDRWRASAPAGTSITAGMGDGHASGPYSHAGGYKFDVGLGGKDVGYIAKLYRSLLPQAGFDAMGLEFSHAKYAQVIQSLKSQNVDTSKLLDYSDARHSGPNADIRTHHVNAPVTINIHGVTDPKAVAREVSMIQKNNSMVLRRTLQGAYA